MKRKLAMLLAAILLLSCLSPALAAETEAAPPAEAGEKTETLFDQFGPWGAWTDEQKTAAESWTQEDWDTYWIAYSDAVSQDDYQMWTEQSLWYKEYYGDAYDYGASLRAQREAAGMPFPDGPNVSLEGKYLDFGGVAPILSASGYSTVLVPFRPFMEAMGAEVTYQKGVAAAALPDGGRIEVKLGDTYLSLKAEGGSSMTAMTPPEAVGGVLYVDVEALAELLGLCYYQDYYYDTVLLADRAALMADIDGEFTHMNAILAAAMTTLDREQTYAGTMELTAAGTLYGDKEHRTATAKVHTDLLSGPAGGTSDTTVKVDLGGLKGLLKDMGGGNSWYMEAVESALAGINGARVRTISTYDGTQYVKGSIPTGSYDFTPPQDTWLRSQYTAGAPGADKAVTVGGLLLAQYGSGGGYDSDPYGTLAQMAQLCAVLLGDDAVEADTVGNTTTYTADVNAGDLLRWLQSAAKDGYYSTEEQVNRLTDSEFRFTMKVQTRDGKLLNMDFGLNSHMGGSFPMTVSARVTGTPLSATGSVSFVGDYLGKIDMTLSLDSRTTTERVPTAPPEGDKVMDYEQAYRAWLREMHEDWEIVPDPM